MSKKKTPSKTPTPGVLVPQHHADGSRGAIWQGRSANPKAGPGRPRSEVRDMLRAAVADRVPVLIDIMDGEVIKRVQVPLASILKHARCFHCEQGLTPLRPDQVMMVTIEGTESASPGDRIKAMDVALRYGVGAEKGYDEALIGALAGATRPFVGEADLEALHRAWVRVIGDHVRGVNSSAGEDADG